MSETRPASTSRRARRAVQSLAGVALMLALGQAPALAATINVGGGCKLVDAITAANTDNAIGLCRAGSGADTIVLPVFSTQTLTQVNNGYVGPSGLPLVTSTITIAGNGSTIARSSAAGTPEFRIFVVGRINNPTGQPASLTLRQTRVTGGSLSSQHRGGGVYRRAGDLTLDGCTISGNTAYLGGGVANAAAGTLTVSNSTISNNSATGTGGGIFNNGKVVNTPDGVLKVANSTISGNTSRAGGGLDNRGSATVTNSAVKGNTAIVSGSRSGIAGGMANFRGSLTVTNSTISGNTARGYDGGGVLNYQGKVDLTNSTISNNSASLRGGGVYNGFGHMTLTNTTVTRNACTDAQCSGGGVFSGVRVDNFRSDVVLFRSLISGNSAAQGAEIFQAPGGVVTANSYNLFGHSNLTNAQAFSGFTPGADITATLDGTFPAPLTSILNPALGNNGGVTPTHALPPGSPAIDGVPTNCSLQKTDQRGVPRPQDGNSNTVAECDVGAFEFVKPGTVTCDGIPATKIGTSGVDTISGTSGVDVIQALAGNDIIKGLAGNDVLCGGPGGDQALGGTGDDRLFGEADVDSVNGEAGFDRCEVSSNGDKATNCEQVNITPDM